jgi:single-stranded-DNA-specific exonuclease
MTEEIVAQIEEKIKNQDLTKEYVIVEKSAEWLPGMLGLAAGKISDRFHRPTFIFCQQMPLSRASARSIPGFNLVEGIARCADILESFGGHAAAAGVVLAEDKIGLFKEKINAVAKQMLKKEDLIPSLEIDLELAPADINWELFDGLERFEPFGQGNKPPKFLVKNLEIKNCRVVGNGSKHLKLELTSEKIAGKIFKAIGFGLAASNNDLEIGDKVDVVFELLIDEWNGNRELQMKIFDIKKI